MRTTDLHQRYYGVYLGTVIATDDPDGLGRVRVETDQLADTKDDPLWATVSRPLAGEAFTVFFTPRAKDQVLVSYIAGDPRQPVVLGYAHHVERKPVGTTETRHAIVTDAGRVTFDEGGRRVIIERPGEPTQRITVGPASTKIEAGAVSVEVTPAGVKVIGGFTVNGERVVLEDFLGVFNAHTQLVGGTPTTAAPPLTPATPGPPNTTES